MVRIRVGIIGRGEYATVATDLGISATLRVRDKWQYIKIGEMKTQLKATKAKHTIGLEDEY